MSGSIDLHHQSLGLVNFDALKQINLIFLHIFYTSKFDLFIHNWENVEVMNASYRCSCLCMNLLGHGTFRGLVGYSHI